MVMVAVRAKGALWGANANVQYLGIGDVYCKYHGPTTVHVTLYFRENANKTLPRSAHHKFPDL